MKELISNNEFLNEPSQTFTIQLKHGTNGFCIINAMSFYLIAQ